ncbi:zinc-binding dehydrogenase [Brevibacillus daliensis]|uniref:zinc-binding dehydrogenase n=1 Tax=Brevibacillus daliensis TaxID=2892995 RepID=UPI001E65CBE0|nr:zinc-binding dehydrogenase [Brevibacillus daliensis]
MNQALYHSGPKGLVGLHYGERPKKAPESGEVRVRLKASGVNRRDLLMINWRNEENTPLTIGCDGAGIIDEIGEGVTNWNVGDEVIIYTGLNWQSISDAPPEDFALLGSDSDGTHATFITLPATSIAKKPEYLTWEEAGVISVAALTAYRALFTKGDATSANTILIPGIGSGVATYLLQFAKATGCRTIVTSRSSEKRKRALELGADLAIDTAEEWNEALQGEKVDIVIDSIGPATFQKSLYQLKKGGKLITFGATTGDDVEFNLRAFFYSQCRIIGTTLGSYEEFLEMLSFMKKHQIHPVIDQIYPLEKGKEALERLSASEQFGKIVLSRS